MKKIISFVCVSVLSMMLVGCGDDEFVKFAKEAIKDNKEHISMYDFNNNKYYMYHRFILSDISSKMNEILDSSAIKDCSKTKEEVNKIVLSDDDITFTCIQSSSDKKVKFQVIGKKSSYNKNFMDSDIDYLFNFNNNTSELKQINQFSDTEGNHIIGGLKVACNISKDKEIYDDCEFQNSRVKIIGL
ncbi:MULTISPECIES: hypothetical protein [unclassified Gilliamella]|uniref:hypothetical protein n=1 Tax=unclassified Gilliamella TaxID=2685620 RepID=UPI001324E8AA|nr:MULTISPECIES: hypothetical protein [unclassified Gilliamella]MWN30868.1 hypothetical protein [Gilliamella sp. Pra-s60]MWP28567.1 hypothetical protein [Gilliamella sp. Pra-s54]